jgi:hypothetical protein
VLKVPSDEQPTAKQTSVTPKSTRRLHRLELLSNGLPRELGDAGGLGVLGREVGDGLM